MHIGSLREQFDRKSYCQALLTQIKDGHASQRPPTCNGDDVVVHATSWQTPPAALMRCSAIFEKNLARTIMGHLGSSPLPQTLKKP